MLRLQLIFRLSTNISKIPSTNSIYPVNQNIAYGYYFPKQWTTDYIYSLIDPRKINILKIHIVKNRLGEQNGKIMFHFVDKETMKKYIHKYNQQYIQTQDSVHRVVIKPFQLKKQQIKTGNDKRKLKNGIKLTNLDFQITKQEIIKLACDYGQIQQVQLQKRQNNLNRGACIVYFKKLDDLQKFYQFVNGLNYHGRKLKGQLINNTVNNYKKQIKLLEYPKIVFQANFQLFKRSIKKSDYIN